MFDVISGGGVRFPALAEFRHPSMSDEGVAFSANPGANFERRGFIFGCISTEGVAFSTTGNGFGCISSEGFALSTSDGLSCIHL